MQVYTAASNSVKFADVELSSLEAAGGVGGAGQLTGTLQVGIVLGNTTLPSALHGTEKVLPTLVTWPDLANRGLTDSSAFRLSL